MAFKVAQRTPLQFTEEVEKAIGRIYQLITESLPIGCRRHPIRVGFKLIINRQKFYDPI